MPNLDGSGPMGAGPYGRGLGPCRAGGRAVPGMGRGRRMGFDRGYVVRTAESGADIRKDMEVEVQALEARLKYLKEMLAEEEKGSP